MKELFLKKGFKIRDGVVQISVDGLRQMGLSSRRFHLLCREPDRLLLRESLAVSNFLGITITDFYTEIKPQAVGKFKIHNRIRA